MSDLAIVKRLPDVLVLLAQVEDDAFGAWSDQWDEITALPVRRWWRRVPSRHHAAPIDAGRSGRRAGAIRLLVVRIVALGGNSEAGRTNFRGGTTPL